mmetsp:Transcript_61499/g.68894  ORF Transcript_61499/g.68894 Transcript_61499/m.68894 type:complete len:98 (+) Transcript_61499:338-631(+)
MYVIGKREFPVQQVPYLTRSQRVIFGCGVSLSQIGTPYIYIYICVRFFSIYNAKIKTPKNTITVYFPKSTKLDLADEFRRRRPCAIEQLLSHFIVHP